MLVFILELLGRIKFPAQNSQIPPFNAETSDS